MGGPAKPVSSSLFGIAIGISGFVIVAAILTSAVLASQLAGDLNRATHQLEAIRAADAAAERARVDRSAVVQAQLTGLQRQNAQQARQELAQRRYLALLAHELRSHGIPVPNPPRATVTAHPKAPRRHPASPPPTGHGPRSPGSTPSPSPSTACSLLPSLCPFLSLPTLLP